MTGEETLPSTYHFPCGVLAGILASVTTQPADVVKTRMQLQPNVYGSFFNTLALIVHNNGVRGLFSGLLPRATRRTLASAFMWTLYEEVSRSCCGCEGGNSPEMEGVTFTVGQRQEAWQAKKKIRILLWGEPEQAVLNDMVSIRTQDRLPRNMGVFNDVYTKFNDPFCFSLSRLSGSLTKLFRDDILLVSANSFVDSLCLDSICFAMLKFFLS